MRSSSCKLPGQPGKLFFGLSPWLLIGVSVVLGLAVFTLAARNSERERQHATQNILDRADALIWALEAGARTGMGFGGQRVGLQPLIEETARQPGVIYMAVIDANGRVLAHSDPGQVGKILEKTMLPQAPPAELPSCLLAEASQGDFLEVYRGFAPLRGGGHGFEPHGQGRQGMRHGHGGRRGNMMESYRTATGSPVIQQREATSFAYIGFDREPFKEALAADYRKNLLTALSVAGLGLAGFISLFWAHSYKNSRRKLKDTQALASEVVTSLPLGLVTSEPSGTLGMINSAALAMLRTSREAVSGAQVRDIPGLDWDAVTSSLSRNEKMLEQEMELRLPGGKSIPVSMSASQIRDDEGSFLGHLFILRDIGEMKRLQVEVRRNERLTVLGNLAAGVAHEIRNPLSSIKGLATYIAKKLHREGEEPAPEEEAAKTMIQEVNRLNRVVSELLEFARPVTIKPAASDINDVITRALRLSDADLRSKNIRVHFTKDPAFPQVRINSERLTQALLNLFLNAVQAMEQDGALDVALELRQDDYAVTIRDSGKGMSAETLASIFTPYFTTKPSGTGLGLAIVHQIVEGHGGKITVTSAPGEGSVFTLLLPLRPAA